MDHNQTPIALDAALERDPRFTHGASVAAEAKQRARSERAHNAWSIQSIHEIENVLAGRWMH